MRAAPPAARSPGSTRRRFGGGLVGVCLAGAVALAACDPDPLRVTRPPTAFAGFDGRAEVGAEINLDGSLSLDPDGDPLSFRWRIVVAPTGSEARLDRTDEPLTRFVPDQPGTYVIGLTVSDGSFEDRDLVGISSTRTSTAPEPLALTLAPATCNLSFASPPRGACADLDGVLLKPDEIQAPRTSSSALAIEWTFVSLPPGLEARDLQPTLQAERLSALSFMPPRPGDYWVSARLVGTRAVSAPTFAAVRVHPPDADVDAVPTPVLRGPRQGAVRERLLLDGRGSVFTSTSARLTWSLFSDPSDGTSSLRDRATGCPPNQCRAFVPVVAGTYVVRLDAHTESATSAPALFTIEVAP